MLLTTVLWEQQPEDWWYLTPESGQHVFFYTNKALEIIAIKYKYNLLICGSYILFIKNNSPIKNLFAKLFLRRKIIRIIQVIVALLPAKGVWKDHLLQKEKTKLIQKQQI